MPCDHSDDKIAHANKVRGSVAKTLRRRSNTWRFYCRCGVVVDSPKDPAAILARLTRK